MDKTPTAMAEIDKAFDATERAIKRETRWLPIIVSAAWGGSLGLVLWDVFTGDDGVGMGISHAIILAFAIFQTWVFWDADARRRTENLKYQTAAGILDEMVAEHRWVWEHTGSAGSVSLRAPYTDDDEDDGTEK
jgi:hypothetical protein